MVQYLVIVESPGKITSVSKFLNDNAQPGDHFVVKATGGHIMNLDPKKLSIQIDNNFEPEYILQDDAWHKKAVAEIKQAYKSCDKVIIASDCDLEGENIGYSVCQLLKLPIETTKRLVFIEITKKAIQQAMQQNTFLQPNLLDAQKSRRVLDRLIGYKISPVTRKIKTGLSVGRVQSIALKLVVDREREIEAFQSQRQFKVIGIFISQIYTTLDTIFTNKDTTVNFLNQCQQPPAEFTISSIKKKTETTNPSPPFITATLQQECCRKFNLTAKQVMDVAQKLYERGLISYPRTDSPHLPDEKMTAIKTYVIDKYGEKYHHARQYKAKNSSAQEAHSCIYPIKVDADSITSDNGLEIKIYQIIHRRAVASQMAAAKIAATELLIDISTTDAAKFKGRAEELLFDGFRKIYQFADHSEVVDDEGSAGDETANMKKNNFKELKEGDKLTYQTITAKECYTNPKARYDYAGLVKSMESLKVGRPSTYPTILENVIERGYIVKESRKGEKKTLITLEMIHNPDQDQDVEIKETTRQQVCGAVKNKFFPTDVGIALEAFIKEYFDNIFNYEFSKEMEDALKKIETGEAVWHEIIRKYYNSFQPIVEQLDASLPAFTSPSKPLKDKRHVGTLPDGRQAYAYVTKNGPAVQVLTDGEIQEMEVGKKVKGRFVSLDNKNLINKITVEDVVRLIQLPKTLGQLDGKDIIVKKGPHGLYLNHNSANYRCCKVFLEDTVMVTEEEAGQVVEEGELGGLSLEKVIAYIKSNTGNGSGGNKANNVIKVIENGKNDPIKVMHGKFGPFFIMNKKIVGIPDTVKPEDITLPICKALLDNKKQYQDKGKTSRTPKTTIPKVSKTTYTEKETDNEDFHDEIPKFSLAPMPKVDSPTTVTKNMKQTTLKTLPKKIKVIK